MNIFFTLIFAAALALSSLSAPAKGGDYEADNKSPCLQEEVYECQASGGYFNWSTCMCRY